MIASTRRELVITLPWPDRRLSPNGRCHWAAKARATRDARDMARLSAMAEVRKQKWKPIAEASVQLVFFSPQNRRRDFDNHLAMCKAYFDGLADAGVIQNDCGFIHMPPRFEIGKRRLQVTVIAEIR